MTSENPRGPATRVTGRDSLAVTQGFYTRWSGLYDALAYRTPGITALRAEAVAALESARGDVVLDMGCGTGANFPHLREAVGPEGLVVGVDVTGGMLARASRRVARQGWTNVHVVRGDATRPPVDDADAVFASFVSGMLDDSAAAVRDWAELVGSGGRLGLLDLARSTDTGRPLNPLFRAFVRGTSPPGRRSQRGSPTRVLDRRIAAAHRALFDVCTDVTHSTHALGFARISAGRVE